MHILLIEPNEGAKQALQYRFGLFRSLSLEQIAALTPPEHNVTILNEKIQTIDYTRPYDLVGLTLMTCTANRGYTIAGHLPCKRSTRRPRRLAPLRSPPRGKNPCRCRGHW